MMSKLLIAWMFMAVCVVIHASGVTLLTHWLRRQPVPPPLSWIWTVHFVHVAGWIVLLHLIEISAFAALYVWTGAMTDVPSAVYFSAVTYTTTGYGDLVLPAEWRLVGSVEALTGILMCGWSTAFFLALVNRMFDAKSRPTNGTV
jgi:hypothetical protein